MTDFGKPPEIPAEFGLYNSYEEDPKWQLKFTIVWCSALAAATILSLPHLVRSFRNGCAYTSMMGVREQSGYESISQKEEEPMKVRRGRRTMEGILSVVRGILLWTAPGIGLNVGQILLLVGYAVTLVVCIVKDSILQDNSNRAGSPYVT
ncbi:ferric-chelate reductase Frp1 [Marasmius tenuissimus]|nr:ferric-chelate reductase Frp1 [Marasmius tenuissimus]